MKFATKEFRKSFNHVVEAISSVLPKTKIDDEDNLFYRIHPAYLKDKGIISPGAYFREEMSTNLERLSSQEATLKGHQGFGLVLLPVGPLRKDCSQKVQHKPIFCNYAHSLVVGNKRGIIQNKIQNLAQRKVLVLPTKLVSK